MPTLVSSLIVSIGLTAADVPLDQQIGQLLIVGFRGTELSSDAIVLGDVRDRHVAGVVLFNHDLGLGHGPRNIESPEQLRRLIDALQAAARSPLLVAIDQEGGAVQRLKGAFGLGGTPSAAKLGAMPDTRATTRHADRIARGLVSLGINFNLAPVIDLNLEPRNPIIAVPGRSFGDDPKRVADHARAFVEAHRRHGVLTALKHFPGHGSSLSDSHFGLPDVTEHWQEVELEPYRRLIKSGHAESIMTAHLLNRAFDPELPATLAPAVLTGRLRQDLGYDGVIVTDSLQMGAIEKRYGLARAVVLALKAGADLLMLANNAVYDPHVAERAIAAIGAAVRSGELSPERIASAYARVQHFKSRLLPSAQAPAP